MLHKKNTKVLYISSQRLVALLVLISGKYVHIFSLVLHIQFARWCLVNLKNLYKTEDRIIITKESKKKYIEYLLQLHKENKLINYIDNGLSFFNEICDKETN